MFFDEIETNRGEVKKEFVGAYEDARKGFLEAYDISKCEGIYLVQAVFNIGDDLLKKYLQSNEITCHRGCSHCCKQLICCTTVEFENILSYLNKLIRNTRRTIVKKMAKEATKFASWYGRTCLDIPEDSHKLISEPIRAYYYGKPCIFLKNNACSIYPVRPIICRTTKVRGDFCGKPVPLGTSRESKPIKLAIDQVLTDIIKEEEKRLYGELKVMPLRVWPLDKQFKKEFFR